jgi:hypothetical protein
VSAEKQPIDRALELFVYAPVGVALYVRDMLPSMMGVFVSRGKREVKSHLGLQEPPAPVPPNVADIRRRVGESVGLARGMAEGGFGLARDLSGTALQGLLGLRNGGTGSELPPRAGYPGEQRATDRAGAADPNVPPSPASAGPGTDTSAPFRYRPPESTAAPAPAASRPEPVPPVESLPIPEYDELSASQVIERLEGLDRESLDAIRAYEAGHRGRNTILGKIAQLS